MKVLLIRPAGKRLYNTVGPDIGFGYLSRALKGGGHEVRIFDCLQRGVSLKDLPGIVREVRPDLAGIKTYTKDLYEVGTIVEMLKAMPAPPMVAVGGPHPSADPDGTLEMMPGTDFAVVGEGEEVFPDICTRLEDGCDLDKLGQSGTVHGLAWRSKNGVNVTHARPVEEIDGAGLPDWDELRPSSYPKDYSGAVYVPFMTTRGCPYRCAYCAGHLVTGRRLRFRKISNIIAELRRLKDHFGVREFCHVDDNFTLNGKFAREVCRAMIRECLGLRWRCTNGLRLDSLDEQTLKLMEEAGCYSVYIGVESGSQRVLDRMGREAALHVMKDKVGLIARATRMHMLGFFIIGYPGEERSDILRSIELARSLPLDMASFFLFTPHPGTKIYEDLEKSGRIKGADWSTWHYDQVSVSNGSLSREELFGLQRTAYLRFYIRWKVVKGLLSKIRTPAQFVRLSWRSLSTYFRI